MRAVTRWTWVLGLSVSSSLAGYLAWAITRPAPGLFLPGHTSAGHYQIEQACTACHTVGSGVAQEACLRCHGQELELAHDSHPPSKFTDPRNADRREVMDATLCVTCHREHRPHLTRAMAVTMPDDFCFGCHRSIGDERPTHQGLGFETCAAGGCHNFHDNRALYVDFLLAGAAEPDLLPRPRVLSRLRPSRAPAGARPDIDAPAHRRDSALERQWSASAHAGAGVSCLGCHAPPAGSPSSGNGWLDRPGPEDCGRCHQGEQQGFFAGKHGMRGAAGLPPMRPGLARQPMKPAAAGRELGCGSCHDPHSTDTIRASVEACEGCHDDRHTRAYRRSEHFRLWQQQIQAATPAPQTGVSCATCHLPRRASEQQQVVVEHNQNANLRPNEKMVREVCSHCHGLGFSLAALADAALVESNFARAPASGADAIRMALSTRKQGGKGKPAPTDTNHQREER